MPIAEVIRTIMITTDDLISDGEFASALALIEVCQNLLIQYKDMNDEHL